MSAARKDLQEALIGYVSDTLSYVDTVRRFCGRISKWMLGRETELNMLMDIKDRADQIDLSISHVTKSENKGEAFLEYMKSKVTQVTADSRRAELQNELAAVLKETLAALEDLDDFLDAVEKLAVTSLHVFMENQVLHLPEEINLELVQVVITAARQVCPLLLEFKRDANDFFLPKLQNVEVLSYQLDRYIQITKEICEKLKKSEFSPKMNKETVVDLDADLSEDDIQRMFCHIEQLDEIRKNQNFRMVFLFQEVSCSDFIREFSERQPRMLQFLKDLEETAVQLDRMKKGAKISSVAGSSVGAVGGVLSTVGLALIPVTAGVSLGLVIGGTALGITSGVNSVVTTGTEIGVNHKHKKKANEVFQSFMEDVQGLQDCLEKAISQYAANMNLIDSTFDYWALLCLLRKSVFLGYQIYSFAKDVYAFNLLKNQGLDIRAVRVAPEGRALANVSRVASEIPDIGEAAAKGSLALSKSARVFFIVGSALSLVMDIFFICKDSISLAKGSETEVSQFIRARAALLSSEMNSWKKIHDCLCEGQQTSEKHQAVLDKPFYPNDRA